MGFMTEMRVIGCVCPKCEALAFIATAKQGKDYYEVKLRCKNLHETLVFGEKKKAIDGRGKT